MISLLERGERVGVTKGLPSIILFSSAIMFEMTGEIAGEREGEREEEREEEEEERSVCLEFISCRLLDERKGCVEGL